MFSDGEDKLFKTLQRRGLTIGLNTHVRLPLDWEKDGVGGTEIDFLWGPEAYAVYLDGEKVHSSATSERRDGLIVAALERRGYTVDRFPYITPLSKVACQVIVDVVETRIKKLRVLS